MSPEMPFIWNDMHLEELEYDDACFCCLSHGHLGEPNQTQGCKDGSTIWSISDRNLAWRWDKLKTIVSPCCLMMLWFVGFIYVCQKKANSTNIMLKNQMILICWIIKPYYCWHCSIFVHLVSIDWHKGAGVQSLCRRCFGVETDAPTRSSPNAKLWAQG